MVKLIQAKYIKHLLMLTAFAFLFSYQQNVKADTDGSLTAAIRIMAMNGVSASSMQAVGELDANAFGLLTFAVAGEDTYLLNNFIASQEAFVSMLREESPHRESIDAATTVMVVDTLSLLVSLIDELIVLGDTTSMDIRREEVAGDDAYNPIVAQAVGLGQIGAYAELFEEYQRFLRNGLDLTFLELGLDYRSGLSGTGPRNTRDMRKAFKSRHDYLGDRSFRQTSECSSLFCSLYTLRIEEPNIPINLFVIRQMQVNEYYASFNSFGTLGSREERDYIRGANFRDVNETLNSLRQSRAATETVLPGNDPNPYQAPEAPEISDECRMAPSLPGC